MAFIRKILFLFSIIIILIGSLSVQAQPLTHRVEMPPINCLNEKLPITFSWVNYDEPSEEIPAVAVERIQRIIIDFYFENGGDSEEVSKAKDSYFTTLRMPLNNLQLFVVILKTPMLYSHCKLFLYDSASNKVSKTAIDYNTWAMYSIEENGIKRSELLKAMHLDSDDLILTQKKQANLLVKRLKHIGTDNELEEITYHPNGLSLDTVSFKSKILH